MGGRGPPGPPVGWTPSFLLQQVPDFRQQLLLGGGARRGRGSGFLLLVEAVQGFYQAEDHKGHDEEVQNCLDKVAVGDHSGADVYGQLGKRDGAGEDAQHRHHDVVNQGVGDVGKRSADDDAHRHVHDVPPGDEGFEFRQEAGGLFCHNSIPFRIK